MDQTYCLISSLFNSTFQRLDKKRVYTIGRDPLSEIHLPSDKISLHHAIFFWVEEERGFVIRDLGSRNGVRVGGQKVAELLLKDNDLVQMGPFALRYRVVQGDIAGLIEKNQNVPANQPVSGAFEDAELIAIGGLVHSNQKSGRLLVDGAQRGHVVFNRGQIVEAVAGEVTGVDAARQVLALRKGRFEFQAAATPGLDRLKPLIEMDRLLVEITGPASKTHVSNTSVASASRTGIDWTQDAENVRARSRLASADLAKLNVRIEFGVLVTRIVGFACLYGFLLTALRNRSLDQRFWAGWGATALAALLVALTIRQSKQPLAGFGLTLAGWKRGLAESLAFSALFIGLATLAKFLLIAHGPLLAFRLDPRLLGYVALAPMQELVFRGGLQGGLERFLEEPKRRFWPIVLTALVFGSMHLHASVTASVAAALLCIPLGILYSRSGSLAGATLSHLLIGLWACFLGVPELVWSP